MERNCKLIATIPVMTDLQKVEYIISNPYIYGVRWNTGIVTPYTEKETVEILKHFCEKYNKKLWIDLKGRQLRVIEWGNPIYSSIKVNHNVRANLPAYVLLRGERPLNLVAVKGNSLFVNPVPQHAVGKGQSVNIIGKDVEIEGYLTEEDKIYIDACKELGVRDLMLSYVESIDDIVEVKILYPDCNIVCKIESKKGLENLDDFEGFNLMAARDDLYLELCNPYNLKNAYSVRADKLNLAYNPYSMQTALQRIIHYNKDAICASKLFTSSKYDYMDFKDFEDLENMFALGYRIFMLSDEVSQFNFDLAVAGWRMFLNG